MQMNSGLGTLVVLPVELRYLIWEHISPSSGPFLAMSDVKQDLSILRILQASRKLREEILSYLYNGLTLTFVISPGLSHQDFNILMHDQRGSRASISNWKDVLAGLAAGSDRALLFERLRAIRIEISAPRRDDPGELLQIWNKNVLLVEGLSSGACLPFLEICAVENDSRQWTTEGTLHQSVASPDAYEDGVDSDLELLLMPFRRLRKARGIQIQIPERTRLKAVAMMVEEIEACVISEKTFGTYLDNTNNMDDEMVASYEDAQTLWFDYILDDMEGPCAAMVRLARFARWTERYGREMYFRTNDGGDIGGAVDMLSERQLTDARSALLERYRAMRAWNPESLQHHSNCEQDCCNYFDGEDVRLDTMTDWWLEETWWCSGFCKRGIPRRSSRAYQDMMERHKDAWTRPLMYYGAGRVLPDFLSYVL